MKKICFAILILFTAALVGSSNAGTFCVSGACFDRLNLTSGSGSTGTGSGTSRRQQRYEEQMTDYNNQTQCIALMRQGNDLYDAGRYQEAYNFYIKAEKMHSVCSRNSYGVPSSVNAMSMVYITNAEGARNLKDYDRCADYVREAMSINPTYAGSWQNLLDRCSSEAKQAFQAIQGKSRPGPGSEGRP
jgi:tetratricopeptide (TPR) repeat protein